MRSRFADPFGILGIGKRTVEGQRSVGESSQQRNAALEDVANSLDSPLIADNSEGAPPSILSANVKEVTGAEYQ